MSDEVGMVEPPIRWTPPSRRSYKTPKKKRLAVRSAYRENPEKKRESVKKWYNLNPDRAIQRSTSWKKAHPERVAAHRRRYYEKTHPRPKCIMCPRTIERGQRLMCKACAKLAKQAATQEWKAKNKDGAR